MDWVKKAHKALSSDTWLLNPLKSVALQQLSEMESSMNSMEIFEKTEPKNINLSIRTTIRGKFEPSRIKLEENQK